MPIGELPHVVATDRSKPEVFLSSTFKDWFDGEKKNLPLRQRILANREMLPVKLWAYEHVYKNVSDNPDADTIIDRCFDGIRHCDLFVFILTGSHGTGAAYFEQRAQASYLELELFAAAALQKPVIILQETSREPDRSLSTVLGIFRQGPGRQAYVVGSEDELYAAFNDACDRLARGENVILRQSIADFPDRLSYARTKDDPQLDFLTPTLRFLGGARTAENGRPDIDLAARLLDQVSTGERMKAGARALLPHGAALFRIWAAMRELMTGDKDQADPQLTALWDHAFGLWASKASWFGLHSHALMSPLAALNSQAALREEASQRFSIGGDSREPLGARASAIYSIAQRVTSRERKLYHYDQAILGATLAMERDQGAQQGILSIRGHALLRSGMLARPWRLWQALADLRRSLDIRFSSGASDASVGEARVDYGFALVATGRLFSGMHEMRVGVALLRSNRSANGLAFLARGLRKLERGAFLTGRFPTAREARAERLALASNIEAMDQARDFGGQLPSGLP